MICKYINRDIIEKMTKKTLKDSKPDCHKSRSACAIANGLELIGDRWTMLILRDLMFTNRNEYGHLLNSGEGIATNILCERLERLQQYKLIEKKPHPNHGKKVIYELTDIGRSFAPVLIEFALWSEKTFPNSYIPEQAKDLMTNDKENLIKRILAGETIFKLDL